MKTQMTNFFATIKKYALYVIGAVLLLAAVALVLWSFWIIFMVFLATLWASIKAALLLIGATITGMTGFFSIVAGSRAIEKKVEILPPLTR